MPSNQHEEDVSEVAKRIGGSTSGFMKKVKSILSSHRYEDWESICHSSSVVPDVFRVDEDAQLIEVHEVFVTNQLSKEKSVKYAVLWEALDYVSWDLVLFEEWGGQVVQVDLSAPYYEWVGKVRPTRDR